MDDLISRQAAIEAARDWYEGLICGSFKGLEKRLRALPSAQPDKDMIHLQKEQAYMQEWEEGRKALREEMMRDADRTDRC